jgi:hypothetical protein
MKKIYATLAAAFAVIQLSHAQVDTSAVHKAGTETITGTKTFYTAPVFTGTGNITGNEWQIVNGNPTDGAYKAKFGNASIYYGSKAGFLFQPSWCTSHRDWATASLFTRACTATSTGF